jgi:aspartyl aminopeptidase
MSSSAADLLAFLNAAKTPYHACALVAQTLRDAGYVELDERAHWQPEPGMRAFIQRAGASLVAIEVGQRPPADAGYVIVGAHTDSPNLRVKPQYQTRRAGIESVSIEPYGGLLHSTWLDRSLSLAGRVVTEAGDVVLIDVDRPLLSIPSLAIHLQRDVNTHGLVLNPQTQLRPLLTLAGNADDKERDPLKELILGALESAQGKSAGSSLTAFDLCLLDATPARFEGQHDDFITSGRLDNLVSCFAGLRGLLAANSTLDATRVLVLYDHEEVGSRSFAGAQSNLLGNVLDRLAQRLAPNDPEAAFRAKAASMLLSADMAHAVHPNFEDKHDDLHRPLLGKGPVLKSNVNQSYATDAISAAALTTAAKRAEIPLQRYVARSDMSCGSTIGPIAAARQGIRTVDVGNPMLGMHACRELCASADVEPYVRLISEWYRAEPPPTPEL